MRCRISPFIAGLQPGQGLRVVGTSGVGFIGINIAFRGAWPVKRLANRHVVENGPRSSPSIAPRAISPWEARGSAHQRRHMDYAALRIDGRRRLQFSKGLTGRDTACPFGLPDILSGAAIPSVLASVREISTDTERGEDEQAHIFEHFRSPPSDAKFCSAAYYCPAAAALLLADAWPGKRPLRKSCGRWDMTV